LSNVDNTSDVNKPVSSATTTQLNLKEATANKGVVSGYAGLDASGKVPVAQLPAAALLSGTVVGPGRRLQRRLQAMPIRPGICLPVLRRLLVPCGHHGNANAVGEDADQSDD
jgi:hypothetical protein